MERILWSNDGRVSGCLTVVNSTVPSPRGHRVRWRSDNAKPCNRFHAGNQSPLRRLAFYQSFVGVIPMDENRVSGVAKNIGGKMEEGFGRATGDAKTRVQGQMRQAEGSIQDLYGQAVDSAEDAIDAVRQMPASVDDTIRHYIETNPYTTAAIALGLGWLIGRSHRPF
jgi:uncharacterized protein YjbJ (UPF0337 family)